MIDEYQPLLIFDLDGTRYGLNATKVLESVWLPELTPIDEAPPWVIGMFNLRGQIVPVTDLNLRFGHPARQPNLNDQVVVLKNENEIMGLMVAEVLEIIDVIPDSIAPFPHFKLSPHGLNHLATGIANIDEDLVTLIDVEQLTTHSELLDLDETTSVKSSSNQLYAETAPEVRARFHARALTLRQSTSEEDLPLLGLAVIEMSGEYFAIELTAVQEFCKITQLRQVPCCPPHILGTISLRGKLFTLIDPRRVLNLAPSSECSKAVIASTSTGLNIGIAVDEVCDVVYLKREELHDPPAALREQCGTEILGTAAYGYKTMTVLELPKLLERRNWVVDEKV